LDENSRQGRSFSQEGTSLSTENSQEGTSLMNERNPMKKVFSLILVAVLVLGLAACGKKKEVESPTHPTAATQAAAATTAAAADMANPMVEITDAAEFGQGLGIDIEADLLYSEAKMFITDGRVAECQFSFENIMGETVECTLRATKDEQLAENLSGVYDSTVTEVNRLSYSSPDGAFEITVSENAAQDTLIYTWNLGDVWYSVLFKGKPSQMEVAEVMDSVMLATGIDTDSLASPGEGTDAAAGEWYKLNEDGTVLTVRLAGNATTGYQWTCKIFDETSLELIEEGYKEDAHADGLVGVGGVWQASFRATGADKRDSFDTYCANDVRFTYSRNWEDGAMPSKVLDLNIVGAEIEIVGVHEPDFTTPVADNGEYEVTLNFEDMIEENEQSVYALVGLPGTTEYRTVHFTDQTELDDHMGKIYTEAAVGNIYSRMNHYGFADAKITVENGFAKKIIIYYHQ